MAFNFSKEKVKKWLLVVVAISGWLGIGAKFIADNLDSLPF